MNNELQQICIALFRKGIEPTTGLIRAKASGNVSVPEAITAMRWWQQQDKDKLAEQTIPDGDTLLSKTIENDIRAQLLARIDAMESQLTELKTMVEALPEVLNQQ